MAPAHPYFTNKVVIVTGSSNGIGRATAILFAENGAKLTIHGRDKNALAETHKLLVAAGAKESDVLEVLGDLTDDATAHQIVEQTVAKFGTVNILINNAGGVMESPGVTTGPNSLDAFDKTIRLNTRSVLLLTELALPHLVKNKGEVVNVSSVAAFKYQAFAPYYAISKAALDQLTTQHATKYVRQGVRVNSVNPGWIDTTIMQKGGITAEQQKAMTDKLGYIVPVGYVAEARQIAELIGFLADRNLSAYIIGQCVVADGGATLELTMFDKIQSEMTGVFMASATKKE